MPRAPSFSRSPAAAPRYFRPQGGLVAPASYVVDLTDSLTFAEGLTRDVLSVARPLVDSVTLSDSAVGAGQQVRGVADAFTFAEALSLGPVGLTRGTADSVTFGESLTRTLAFIRSLPTFLLQDSFADVTGTALDAHTSDTGSGWTHHPSFTFGAVTTSGGRLRPDTTNATGGYYSGFVPSDADYAVEADLVYLSSISSFALGVYARMSTTVHTGYLFMQSTGSWILQRLNGGVATTLASVSGNISPGTTRRIRLEVVGSRIIASVWAGQTITVGGHGSVFDVTDASPILTAGRPGLRMLNSVIGDTSGLHMDNYRVAPYASLDSINFSESMSAVVPGLTANITDSITFSEALARGPLGETRTLAASLTFGESLTRTLTLARALSDSATFSDSVSRTVAVVRALAASLTFSESLVRSGLASSRALADSVTFSEALARSIMAYSRTLVASLTFSESLSTSTGGSQVRAVTDAITFSDALSRATLAYSRTLTGSLTFSEAMARVSTFTRTLAAAVTLADTVARVVGIAPRPVADALHIADAVSAPPVTRSRSVLDALTLSEALSRGPVSAQRTITGSLSLAEVVVATLSGAITLTDVVDSASGASVTDGPAGSAGSLLSAMSGVSATELQSGLVIVEGV